MKYIYAMLGAPGVGKTTFLKEASKEIYGDNRLYDYVLGPDDVRRIVAGPELKPDGSYAISSKNEGFVWKFVNEVLKRKTDNGELVIMDATHSRESAIANYKQYSDRGYRVVIIDFREYTDLEEIKRRNRTREAIKFVPEKVIDTMHERLKTLNMPTWVEVIKPEEFKEHFMNIKYNFDEFESLTFIGDIHSCADELEVILDLHDIDPDTKEENRAIISVGDFFDRGPKPVETFRLLQKLVKNKAFWPLMGNHEEPLRYYKEFQRDVHENFANWVKEFVYPKYSLDDPELELEAKPVFQKGIALSYKKFDEVIEELKSYPNAFKAFKGFVQGYKLPTELKKEPDGYQKIRGTSLSTMKQFLISDIKYTEVADLIKRCAQLFYGDFHGTEILATHAGLPTIPDKTTPTSLMIRGVGSYGEAKACMETFEKKHPGVIQIHGHRNVEGLPIRVGEAGFNINGDVDVGLRAVQIFKDKSTETTEVSPRPDTVRHYRERQLRSAKQFKARKLSIEDESQGIMQLFQDHKHVEVKKLPDNVAAINFTRKAFEKGAWDDITIKARGLFMAIDPQNDLPQDYVIARGYEKFFNVGERYGFDERDIRQLAYPLKIFEKANGYLGLLSVDTRGEPKWFIASKSTTEGDYAENFRKLITPHLTQELMDRIIKENVTLVFEVIDPIFDPHIEAYKNEDLVLLDCIKNQIQFEKLDFEVLDEFKSLFNGGVRIKKLIKVCETFNDYHQVVKEANSIDLLSKKGIEGFVIEDALEAPNMFKIKTKWYSFWKYHRGIMHRVLRAARQKTKKGGIPHLNKSDLINLKKNLHTFEDIKVFNFMVEYVINNFDLVDNNELSIIDLRDAMETK